MNAAEVIDIGREAIWAMFKMGYGIVKQFGGYVFVDSEPGQGASFNIFLPQMDGRALTKEVEARRPDIKVIYISGYAEDAFRSKIDSKVNFLPKTFSLGPLATKVKDVMAVD